MAGRFVLDSSALAKTFLREAETAAFVEWLRGCLEGGGTLLAPTLVVYELGEIVRQKRSSSPAERRRIVRAASGIVRLISHESILEGAFDHTDGLTFYDASFLALAKATEAALVTYDARLAEGARRSGVNAVSPGV